MSFVIDWYALKLECVLKCFSTSFERGTVWVSHITAWSLVSVISSLGSTWAMLALMVASCSSGISDGVVTRPTP